VNRMAKTAGALVTAVVVAVLVTPSTTANPRERGVLAGLDSAGTVYSPASAESTAAFDVPDIEWPPPGVTPPGHSADRLREFAATMQAHLDTAFPAVVPEAENLSWIEWGAEHPGEIVDGQDYLTTFSVYSDEIGRTGQFFQIEAPGHFTSSPRDQCAQEGTVSCSATILDDGSLVLDWLVEWTANDRVLHIQSVMHYRTDGTVVWVEAFDYDPIFDGNEGPDRDEVALTIDQLTTLATDPALHL
jgi:hypothetical protein